MNTLFDFPGLSSYRGKTVLIVNTASECGYTPQYKGLQALHEKYGAKGLVVLAFPSNDFGAQEPGSDAEIGAFCEKNYGVDFPILPKAPVKGDAKQPVFRFLTEGSIPGEVKWNFEKFLVCPDGKLIARFPSKTEPNSAELTSAIEKALS